MNYTYDITGKIIVNISNEEFNELENIKEELLKELNNFIEYEREELYFETSKFITNNSIKSKLANLKHHIITDLDYNEDLKNVVYIENGSIHFSNDNKFYQFASAYDLLNSTTGAQRVLKNYLRVQIIDWLIKNDYNHDNAKDFIYKINKDITTKKSNSFNNKIFKGPYSENLFYYILKEIKTKNTFKLNSRKNRGAFYTWLIPHLDCTKYTFALFWNDLDLPKITIYDKSSPSLPTKEVDYITKELNYLKSEFDKINTSV